MATRKQKAKVGLFLVACTLLIIGGVILVTGLKYEPRHVYYVEFQESVLGLSTGGMVEYMGVPVGNVSNIVVKLSEETGAPVALVTLEIIREKVTLYGGVVAQLVVYSFATGTMAVSLSGGDPTVGQLPPGSYIPAKSSLVAAVSSRIETILDDLSDIINVVKTGLAGIEEGDLTALIDRTNNVLAKSEDFMDEANKLLTDIGKEAQSGVQNFNEMSGDFRDLIRNTNEAVITLRKQVEALNLKQSSENLNKVFESIKTLAERLQQTADVVENLAKSAQTTSGDLEYSLRQTLRTLGESLDAVRDLADYLRQDPSSLLRGKGEPAGE